MNIKMRPLSFTALLCLLVLKLLSASDTVTTIAVYPVKSDILPDAFSTALSEHIESKLLSYSSYKVISRSNLDILITEDHLMQSGILPDSPTRKTSPALSTVEKICTGSVNKIGSNYTFTLKIIDVNTGNIDASAQRNFRGTEEALLDTGYTLLKQLCSQTGKKRTSVQIKQTTMKNYTNIQYSTDTTITPLHEKPVPKEAPITKNQPAGQNVTNGSSQSAQKFVASSPRKPSGLAKRVSIGAAAVFATVAALVLISKFN